MKTGFSKFFLWVVTPSALLVAGLITMRFSQTSNAASQPTYAPSANVAAAVATQPAPAPQISPMPENVPVQSVLPSNIIPGSPLAEVIKLAKAGVAQGVILSYVTNSSGTFNLDSDKIIYLSDTGVPNEVVSVILQHDQQLQLQMAAATAPQPTPEPAAAPVDTGATAPQPEPEQVTVNYFNSALTPYGSWVELPGYGRCWRPTITVYDTSWQPYCDRGHWVYTDCGWYWNSDYSWGSTFHYGRWFRDTRLGWCWWPDTVWAPSWVTWRSGNDFCGWAPLPPFAVCQPGLGFVYQGNGVSFSFDFGLAPSCFTFVPTANFCDVRLRNHCFAPAQVTQVFNHTTVINNIDINNRVVFNHGITAQQISRAIGTPIRQMSAHDLRTAVHEVRTGTFNRPNHTSNDGQNSSTATAGRNSSERNHSPGNTQPHFTAPGANFNSTATADNSSSNPRTTSAHSQPFDQTQTPRNVARNYVETHQNVVVQQQNLTVAPVVNRSQTMVTQSQSDSNPSRREQIADIRQNRSEAAAAAQSHAQQQQAASVPASQPVNSSRQDKIQKLLEH